MYQSAKTKLDAVNEALALLDLSTVVTTTDTHTSRTMVTVMKQALHLLTNQADWLELTVDTPLNQLTPYVSQYTLNGQLGFQFDYFPRVDRVVDMETGKSLCFTKPSNFEKHPLTQSPFPITTDVTFITSDSALYTTDLTGSELSSDFYTMHYNAIFLPPTTNWGRYKVTHTKPLTLPDKDLDKFDAPEYMIDLLVLGAAYRYAAMYSPARNDTAAARVSGLRMMYEESLRTLRTRQLSSPKNFKRSVI